MNTETGVAHSITDAPGTRAITEDSQPDRELPLSTKSDTEGSSSSRLDALTPFIHSAQEYAEQWLPAYRKEVFRTALALLIGDMSGDRALPLGLGISPGLEMQRNARNTVGNPIEKLAGALGAEAADLERVIYFTAEGDIQILPRIATSSNRESQILYSLVYCYVKEIGLGVRHVEGEDLRRICVANGCYDRPNFSTNYKKAAKDGLIREIVEGNIRKYMATTKGLEVAADVIQKMLTA